MYYPLKILHIIDSGGLYGAEVMLLNLAKEQQFLGMEPVIGSIGEKGISEKPVEDAARKAGISVKIFRMKPGLNIHGIHEVLAYCHNHGFHLLHSHGYKGNILFGFLPRKMSRIPVIATLHGWTSTNGLSKMRIYEWLDARSLPFLDAVVVVNRKMLNHARLPRINSEKLFVVDNGIPVERDETVALDQDIKDFCQDGVVLGTIGRCSREKGFDILLHVLQSLRHQGVNAKLLLIGEGPLKGELMDLAVDLGVDKFVFFAGYQDRASVYMSLMDVYVISSLTEGLPMTLLEAMKAKVPIVATAVGGIPDVLEHEKDALLVSPHDVSGLVAAIEQIEDDLPLSFIRAEAAYEKFIQKYSSRKMALAYSDVYRQIDLPVDNAGAIA